MKIKTEDLYREWHKQIHLVKGIHVKSVKDFDVAKNKPSWLYFEACTNLINRNDGFINVTFFLKSLAEYYGGYFNPKILVTRKAIKVYSDYKKIKEQEYNIGEIAKSIKRSVRFVVKYCLENNIQTFREYVNEGKNIMPTFIKHASALSLSNFFIACIPNFGEIINSYPLDIRNSYGKDLKNRYNLFRMRLVNNIDSKMYINQVESIIDNILTEIKKEETAL